MSGTNPETVWSIDYMSSEGNDKNWFCSLSGDGPMPAVPRVGDKVTGKWLPNDSDRGLAGIATVIEVRFDVQDGNERGGQHTHVIVLLRRDSRSQ